jgi:hypothetical protein
LADAGFGLASRTIDIPEMAGKRDRLFRLRRGICPEADGTLLVRFFRMIVVGWILAGLLVCVERTPDTAGHAHAFSAGHPMESWHDAPDGSSSTTQGSDFHFHVVKDFTSVDTDVPLFAVPTGDDDHCGNRLRGANQRPPESPVFESEGPPLIVDWPGYRSDPPDGGFPIGLA